MLHSGFGSQEVHKAEMKSIDSCLGICSYTRHSNVSAL